MLGLGDHWPPSYMAGEKPRAEDCRVGQYMEEAECLSDPGRTSFDLLL